MSPEKITLLTATKLLLALMLIYPRPASSDEPSARLMHGSEIEEPIGETIETSKGTRQCFDRKEWSTMGSLIMHYHWVYQLAGLYLVKNHKQAVQVENLQRYKTELLLKQNQSLMVGDKLRLELESERRKKRMFAWFAGISAGASVVLGFVLYGVASQ